MLLYFSPICSAHADSQKEEHHMTSPISFYDQLNRTLDALTDECSAFLTFLLDPEAEQVLVTRLSAGRFTKENILRGDIGYRSDFVHAHVVHGDFYPNGNTEGSFYVHFGAGGEDRQYSQVLRLRWAGDHALYLNGSGNYIRTNWRLVGGKFRAALGLGRIGGNAILAIEKAGVRLQHPRAYDKRQYDELVAAGRRPVDLEDPGAADDIIVPHADLITILEGMREGLRAARAVMDEMMNRSSSEPQTV